MPETWEIGQEIMLTVAGKWQLKPWKCIRSLEGVHGRRKELRIGP